MATRINNSRKAVRQAGKYVRDALRKDADEIKNKAKHAWQSGKDKVYEAEEKMEEYVADNPKRSIAISAAVGAVIGILLASSLHRKRFH